MLISQTKWINPGNLKEYCEKNCYCRLLKLVKIANGKKHRVNLQQKEKMAKNVNDEIQDY